MRNGKRGVYALTVTGWSNQQLLKDCGIIPYLLYKNHGFHAVMVSTKKYLPLEKYPFLKYVRGMELHFWDDTLEARLKYIRDHIDDMDLMLLHGCRVKQYLPFMEYYKSLRPDGKIYLATDANINAVKNFSGKDIALNKFIHSCDVVAVSCRAVQKYIAAKWNVPVELIRNGWYNFPKISFDNLFERKENIILSVGRVGADIPLTKRTDILMEAFAKVAAEFPDWKLRLVGDIHESFKPYIEKFFAARPDLKERITFTGNIEDKTELAEEYKRAKIFCLTSPSEGGTPNVTAEALFAGDFMIFSAVDAAYEATDDNRCGRVFPIGNVDALAQIFREVCRDENLLATGGHHAVNYARKNFDAEHIVAKLHYLLYGGNAQ